MGDSVLGHLDRTADPSPLPPTAIRPFAFQRALASVTKARFTADSLVAASQPDSTHYRSERLSDPRSLCRRGPTFPSRRHDLPHRADGDGPLRSECSCRSWHTPCGVQDWLRLGTAIPSGPSPSPRLGAVPPVRRDLHLDLDVRSLHADRVARYAARRGCAQHYAGLDVIDGPMQRARDLPPDTSPSESEPPRWVQVSSMA